MSGYKIFSTGFGGGVYDRLAEVFKTSVRQNTTAELEFVGDKEPPEGMNTNQFKLDLWKDAVAKADKPLVLIDCDMVVLRDLGDAFDEEFDIGITTRPSKSWFNGGVVFVRPSKKTTRFFERWKVWNDYLIDNPDEREKAVSQHVGLNQPAFVWLLEREGTDCEIKHFPCSEWNCGQVTWADFGKDTTRCLHVKSILRYGIKKGLQPSEFPGKLEELAAIFYSYDTQVAKGAV